MKESTRLTFNTGSSVVVRQCQVCGRPDLEPIIFLGYFPPPSAVNPIGEKPHEEMRYPSQLLYCPHCHLVQMGVIIDPRIIFPATFPYTSSTTRVLRDNFTELYKECNTIVRLGPKDLIVDIGSNDGNLLSNFKDSHRVLGVTPEAIGKIAIERGVPTIIDYFNSAVAARILSEYGLAKVVTATNVLAHMESINEVMELILKILTPDGVFISESHYLASFIEKLQYDTIYHEHLRYYSLHSLQYLLKSHGLEIIHAKRIPPHGGSIRVYAARKGKNRARDTVAVLLDEERSSVLDRKKLLEFRDRVVLSRLELNKLLSGIKKEGKRIYGVGAAARASTLINYTGLGDGILDCVLEVTGSRKIGNYMPGTLVPVLEESRLFADMPEYALLLSWHIADELMPKLKTKGFRGDFIVPLPDPRIVKGSDV